MEWSEIRVSTEEPCAEVIAGLFHEWGAGGVLEIASLCTGKNLNLRKLRFIHPYQDRDANLVLVEAARGSKAGVKILPPLVVYKSDGNYTEEILRIYSEDQAGAD